MRKQNFLIIGIVLAIAIVIGITSTGFLTLNQDREEIKIGGAFALTGFASEWGEGELIAARLAIDEINQKGGINGKKVRLIVEDTQTDSLSTINAFNKLINIDRVDAIVGSTWLESFVGAGEISENNKILTISPSSSISMFKEKQFDFVYTTWYREDFQSEFLLKHLSDNNKKKIVFILSNEPYWQAYSEFLKEKLEEYDVTLLYEISFNPERTDFRSDLLKIKDINPDVIFFGSDSEHSIFSLIKQSKEFGFDISNFYSNHSTGIFLQENNKDKSFNGVRYVNPIAMESEFLKEFYKTYPNIVSPSVTNTYDAVMIISKVLENTEDVEDITKYLRNNSFDTITFGKDVSFDFLNGLLATEFEILEIS
jgi:branched-chain amino acid transport system substrate-binding protein